MSGVEHRRAFATETQKKVCILILKPQTKQKQKRVAGMASLGMNYAYDIYIRVSDNEYEHNICLLRTSENYLSVTLNGKRCY